jgi:hypothetical protein
VLALQVDGMVSLGPRQEHGYRNTVQMDKMEGAEELGYGAYLVQLRWCGSSRSSKEPFRKCKEI